MISFILLMVLVLACIFLPWILTAKQKKKCTEWAESLQKQQDDLNSSLATASLQLADITLKADRKKEEIGLLINQISQNKINFQIQKQENEKFLSEQIKASNACLVALQRKIDSSIDFYIPESVNYEEMIEKYGYTETGKRLQEIKKEIRELAKSSAVIRTQGKEIILNAKKLSKFISLVFNAQCELLLSNVTEANVGKLQQKVRDVALVLEKTFDYAFSISDDFLETRIEEIGLSAGLDYARKLDKEENARRREELREEQKIQRDIERSLRETEAKERQLQKRIAEVQAKESMEQDLIKRTILEEQIKELQTQLELALQDRERAISMAQQTKRGYVYVISNVGSFGEGIYKIGMTRRLEPLDRVKELGDASVPFAFDIHALIYAEDAPALEKALHHRFALSQVNKANFRKEFFKANIEEIQEVVDRFDNSVEWVQQPKAPEYMETKVIEEMIKTNPTVRQEWMDRQKAFDDLTYYLPNEEE